MVYHGGMGKDERDAYELFIGYFATNGRQERTAPTELAGWTTPHLTSYR